MIDGVSMIDGPRPAREQFAWRYRMRDELTDMELCRVIDRVWADREYYRDLLNDMRTAKYRGGTVQILRRA